MIYICVDPGYATAGLVAIDPSTRPFTVLRALAIDQPKSSHSYLDALERIYRMVNLTHEFVKPFSDRGPIRICYETFKAAKNPHVMYWRGALDQILHIDWRRMGLSPALVGPEKVNGFLNPIGKNIARKSRTVFRIHAQTLVPLIGAAGVKMLSNPEINTAKGKWLPGQEHTLDAGAIGCLVILGDEMLKTDHMFLPEELRATDAHERVARRWAKAVRTHDSREISF